MAQDGFFGSQWRHHPRGLAGRVVQWFRDLPSVPKLVLLGLVLLSPLAYILATLLLVVSVSALIFQAFKRRPLRTWGIVAASSLVVFVMFGGISNTVYSFGLTGTGGDKPKNVPPERETPDPKLSDQGGSPHLDAINFEIQNAFEMPVPSAAGGGTMATISSSADSLYEEDIKAIANYVAEKSPETDYIEVMVTRDPRGSRSRAGACDSSTIKIANTAAGATIGDVRAGSFEYTCKKNRY